MGTARKLNKKKTLTLKNNNLFLPVPELGKHKKY